MSLWIKNRINSKDVNESGEHFTRSEYQVSRSRLSKIFFNDNLLSALIPTLNRHRWTFPLFFYSIACFFCIEGLMIDFWSSSTESANSKKPQKRIVFFPAAFHSLLTTILRVSLSDRVLSVVSESKWSIKTLTEWWRRARWRRNDFFVTRN